MKKVLSFSIILFFMLILTGCINKKELQEELVNAINSSEQHIADLSKDGYLEDNVYYYPDLNIKFEIPDTLRILTNREINILVYGATDQPSDDDNVLIYELYALNMDDNSAITLMSDTPAYDYSIDDYVSIFFNTISANSEEQNTTVSDPEECEICGHNFIKIRSIINDRSRCVDVYIIKVDNKFVSIQIVSNSEEEALEYLSIIKPLE